MPETTEQPHQTALQAAREYGGLKVEVNSLSEGLRELKQDTKDLQAKFNEACMKLTSIENTTRQLLHSKNDSEKKVEALERNIADLVRSIKELRDHQKEHQEDHCEDCKNEKMIKANFHRLGELTKTVTDLAAAATKMQETITAMQVVPKSLQDVRTIVTSKSFISILRILNIEIPRIGRLATVLFWLILVNLMMSFYLHRDFAVQTWDSVKSHF